jgi:hypothetical protein
MDLMEDIFPDRVFPCLLVLAVQFDLHGDDVEIPKIIRASISSPKILKISSITPPAAIS